MKKARKVKSDFHASLTRALGKTGITQTDLAQCVDLSRSAVAQWVRRGSSPNRWVRPKVEHALRAINAALDEGLTPPHDPEKRQEWLREQLLKH